MSCEQTCVGSALGLTSILIGFPKGLMAPEAPCRHCPMPLMKQRRSAKLWWQRPFTLTIPTSLVFFTLTVQCGKIRRKGIHKSWAWSSSVKFTSRKTKKKTPKIQDEEEEEEGDNDKEMASVRKYCFWFLLTLNRPWFFSHSTAPV